MMNFKVYRKKFALITAYLISISSYATQAEKLKELEQTNMRIVTDFYRAWPSADMEKITAYMNDTVIYTGIAHSHQSENPVLNGKQAFHDYWWSMIKNLEKQKIEVVRIKAIGDTILTERKGYLTLKGKTYFVHVGSFFYIKEGKIETFTEYLLPVSSMKAH